MDWMEAVALVTSAGFASQQANIYHLRPPERCQIVLKEKGWVSLRMVNANITKLFKKEIDPRNLLVEWTHPDPENALVFATAMALKKANPLALEQAKAEPYYCQEDLDITD